MSATTDRFDNTTETIILNFLCETFIFEIYKNVVDLNFKILHILILMTIHTFMYINYLL